MKKYILLSILSVLFISSISAQIITTIAGDSTAGYCCDGLPAIGAKLSLPYDVAVDNIGNLYIADANNNRIRKINSAGIITTIAGTGISGYNGDSIPATIAQINVPSALAIDGSGNIYFSDDHNYRIRMISNSGIITTVAGTGISGYSGDNGPATNAQITSSVGIAVDGAGHIFFGDILNNRIRRVSSASNGIITTIAGTNIQGYSGDGGPATLAELYNPTGLAIDGLGNVFFGEHGNNCIRKINNLGIIITVAGTGVNGFSGDNGPATQAKLSWPDGLKIDGDGNIYFTDAYNNRVRKVDYSGLISTIAGTGDGSFTGDGGPAIAADLHTPLGLAINHATDLFVADAGNNCIRYIRNTVSVSHINIPHENLSLYPNPNKGEFEIKVESALNENVQLIVTNITGRKIKEISANTNKPVDFKISVPSGIYFLTAITTHGWETKKVVIMEEGP
jgi:sugar lactone lactonase YvrE